MARRGFGVPARDAQGLHRAPVGLLVVGKCAAPFLCHRDGAAPVARGAGAIHQPAIHSRQLSLETCALLLDPGAKLFGTQILASRQKIPPPELCSLILLARLDRQLEGSQIELDGAGAESHGVWSDLEGVSQLGLELGEGLAERVAGPGLVAMAPEQCGPLGPGYSPRAPPGQGREDRKRVG